MQYNVYKMIYTYKHIILHAYYINIYVIVISCHECDIIVITRVLGAAEDEC